MRADHRTSRLVIADAKDTETAGCFATRHRLLRYCEAARKWGNSGYTIRVAICHGAQTGNWIRTLTSVVSQAGLKVIDRGVLTLDAHETVSWVDGIRISKM